MHIYKYQTSIIGQEPLVIPLHAKLLKVAMQNHIPIFWFEISDAQESVATNLRIHIIGTGQHFDHPALFEYYDTIFHQELVWHVYVDNWILKTKTNNGDT